MTTTESLPVRPEMLHEELESMRKLLQHWELYVSKGITGVDFPTERAEELVEKFRRELSGELTIVAGRAQALAVVISEG